MNKFLAVCDCCKNMESGTWEVHDQRDWNVPDFSEATFKTLCDATDCDDKCDKCIVTRIKEAVLEGQC